MYANMVANEDWLVSENIDGLNKAIKEDYAFLMESASIEYYLLFIYIHIFLYLLFLFILDI